jgi:hypothetical protein
MDIQRNITTTTITGIKQLALGHPVFLLSCNEGAVVLKAEATGLRQGLAMSAEVMSVVEAGSASRVLSKPEIMKIRDFANRTPGALEELNPGSLKQNITDALALPIPGKGNVAQATWVVMAPKKDMMDMEEALMDRLAGDKTKVKLFTKALNTGDGLKRLGLILAGDAFNGNQDRINFEGGGINVGDYDSRKTKNSPGDATRYFKLKTVQNPKNLFIADDQNRMAFVGLDQFDPNSAISRAPDTFNPKVFYAGVLLRDDKAADRRKMLQDVADDIEALLGPRNRKAFFLQKTRVPKDGVSKMELGMKEGGQKILMHLKQKYAQGGMPIAMKDRLTAIGWYTRVNFPRG